MISVSGGHFLGDFGWGKGRSEGAIRLIGLIGPIRLIRPIRLKKGTTTTGRHDMASLRVRSHTAMMALECLRIENAYIHCGQIANQTERRELYKLFKGSKNRETAEEDGDDEVTTKAKSRGDEKVIVKEVGVDLRAHPNFQCIKKSFLKSTTMSSLQLLSDFRRLYPIRNHLRRLSTYHVDEHQVLRHPRLHHLVEQNKQQGVPLRNQ